MHTQWGSNMTFVCEGWSTHLIFMCLTNSVGRQRGKPSCVLFIIKPRDIFSVSNLFFKREDGVFSFFIEMVSSVYPGEIQICVERKWFRYRMSFMFPLHPSSVTVSAEKSPVTCETRSAQPVINSRQVHVCPSVCDTHFHMEIVFVTF